MELLRQSTKGGSGYTLGSSNDFTTMGLVTRSPQAVWVALFRPYLWESTNVVMFISGFENIILLLLTVFVIAKTGIFRFWRIILKDPYIFFSVVFVLAFAFAIGISSYNFGTLVRYKIPLIPYFLSALVIINSMRRKPSTTE